MKKLVLVAAAAGLMSVAACTKTPEQEAVLNNAEVVADNLEMTADNLEAVSNTTLDPTAKDGAEAAAENLEATASNVRDAADAKADNMTH